LSSGSTGGPPHAPSPEEAATISSIRISGGGGLGGGVEHWRLRAEACELEIRRLEEKYLCEDLLPKDNSEKPHLPGMTPDFAKKRESWAPADLDALGVWEDMLSLSRRKMEEYSKSPKVYKSPNHNSPSNRVVLVNNDLKEQKPSSSLLCKKKLLIHSQMNASGYSDHTTYSGSPQHAGKIKIHENDNDGNITMFKNVGSGTVERSFSSSSGEDELIFLPTPREKLSPTASSPQTTSSKNSPRNRGDSAPGFGRQLLIPQNSTIKNRSTVVNDCKYKRDENPGGVLDQFQDEYSTQGFLFTGVSPVAKKSRQKKEPSESSDLRPRRSLNLDGEILLKRNNNDRPPPISSMQEEMEQTLRAMASHREIIEKSMMQQREMSNLSSLPREEESEERQRNIIFSRESSLSRGRSMERREQKQRVTLREQESESPASSKRESRSLSTSQPRSPSPSRSPASRNRANGGNSINRQETGAMLITRPNLLIPQQQKCPQRRTKNSALATKKSSKEEVSERTTIVTTLEESLPPIQEEKRSSSHTRKKNSSKNSLKISHSRGSGGSQRPEHELEEEPGKNFGKRRSQENPPKGGKIEQVALPDIHI